MRGWGGSRGDDMSWEGVLRGDDMSWEGVFGRRIGRRIER